MIDCNVNRLRSIKKVNEYLWDVDDEINRLTHLRNSLQDRWAELHSLAKFKFPCGNSVRFGEITLLEATYTERGLGYADDKTHFNEFQFYHDDIGYRLRFVSESSIVNNDIPHHRVKQSGRMRVKQCDFGEEYNLFKKKFKQVIRIESRESFQSSPEDRFYTKKGFLTL